MSERIYREDDRAKLRLGLSSEKYRYVMALEEIACRAYHVWQNTPHANKPHALTVECLNNLYDALAKVDFMEGDETRDA